MTISEKIFSLLKENNMSQKEFSQKTGISEAAISDWKKRGTNPSSEKILKICEVLDVSPNELLMYAESKNRSIKPVDYLVYDGQNRRSLFVEGHSIRTEEKEFLVPLRERIDAYCRQFGYKLTSTQRLGLGFNLNPSDKSFIEELNSVYVDKTGMLDLLNQKINSRFKYICLSRPRRFGKTLAEKMMAAYYGYGLNTKYIFDRLEISSYSTYEEYLNKYDVLVIDMQTWQIDFSADDAGIIHMEESIIKEFAKQYPGIITESLIEEGICLNEAIMRVYENTGRQFVLLIDEWDSIFRNEPDNKKAHSFYINWLKRMFKSYELQSSYALVYMTGILPIMRYGTESALNNFTEISFVNPRKFAPYTGFTENEVKTLCEEYGMDFDTMKYWYDGYFFEDGQHIFNPTSVMYALHNNSFESYWSRTGTFENIKRYIVMNYDGLKDDVITLLGGGRICANITYFQNDMNSICTKEDVWAVLCHLGYLAYDKNTEECWIPNKEIREEFKYAIKTAGWGEVTKALEESKRILNATWEYEAGTVAELMNMAHFGATSVLRYNDENSLSCAITIAYYFARNYYTLIRELPTGKGFADIAFFPRKGVDKPAMLVELKWDMGADSGIKQIKDKQYYLGLEGYLDNLILVCVNYDKKTKEHTCIIEKYTNK